MLLVGIVRYGLIAGVCLLTGDLLAGTLKTGQLSFPAQSLTLTVEIADTEQSRLIGLMNRELLPVHTGMLFIFDQEQHHRVWMKNTRIPLDIIFISAQGRVVAFFQKLPSCYQSCDIYTSPQPAKFMLELNAGMIAKHAIRLNDLVTITQNR